MPKLIGIVWREAVDAVIRIEKCGDQADNKLEYVPYFETNCVLPKREFGLFPRLIYHILMIKIILIVVVFLLLSLSQMIHAIEIFVVLLFSKASEEVSPSAFFEIFSVVRRFEAYLRHLVE